MEALLWYCSLFLCSIYCTCATFEGEPSFLSLSNGLPASSVWDKKLISFFCKPMRSYCIHPRFHLLYIEKNMDSILVLHGHDLSFLIYKHYQVLHVTCKS